MRAIGAMLLLVAAAACQQRDRNNQTVAETKPAAEAAPDERLACAVNGAPMATACTFTQARSDRGTVLTVHHPDGGFRRLLLTADGRGVIAADGAQPATVRIASPETIEVSIADDRYRLPATVRARP